MLTLAPAVIPAPTGSNASAPYPTGGALKNRFAKLH